MKLSAKLPSPTWPGWGLAMLLPPHMTESESTHASFFPVQVGWGQGALQPLPSPCPPSMLDWVHSLIQPVGILGTAHRGRWKNINEIFTVCLMRLCIQSFIFNPNCSLSLCWYVFSPKTPDTALGLKLLKKMSSDKYPFCSSSAPIILSSCCSFCRCTDLNDIA